MISGSASSQARPPVNMTHRGTAWWGDLFTDIVNKIR
jgi:hypothetical protein